MKLLISTRNWHKLREIREILDSPDLEILSMDDFPELPEVEEDKDTFAGNAIKKAETQASLTGLWVLADDSGLEVDALGGEPGVYSARYAGEPPDYAANNKKLLLELDGVKDRTARFRCVIALARPDVETETVEGKCEGKIGFTLCGETGFGYDPLFIPGNFDLTFAELDANTKNRISHRGMALKAARDAWWRRQKAEN